MSAKPYLLLLAAWPLSSMAQDSSRLPDVFVVGERPKHWGITEGSGLYSSFSSDTATRLNLAPKRTPQVINILTQQLLLDQNLTTVADVVNATPGLQVVQIDSDRTNFTARGQTINNIMRDGVPIYYDTRVNYGDNSLNTLMFDRVEVLKGATGLMQAPSQPSAAINLIRKKPTATPKTILGSHVGSQRRVQGFVDTSGPLNQAATARGRLVAAYEQADGHQRRQHRFAYPFYGILEFDLGTDTLLTVGANHERSKISGSMIGGLPIFNPDSSFTHYGRRDSTAPSWASSENVIRSAFTSLRHALPNGWQLSGSATYDHSTLAQKGLQNRTTTSTQLATPLQVRHNRAQRSFDLNLQGDYDWLGHQQAFVTGIRHNSQHHGADYTTLARSCCSPLGDFTDPGWTQPEPEWGNIPKNRLHGRDQGTAWFANTHVAVSDDFSFIIGGNLASWRTQGIDQAFVQEGRYQKRLPYVSVLYDLSPEHTLYASYSKTFNPSTLRDRHQTLLPPVSGQHHEFGLKGNSADETLNYALSFFHLKENSTPVLDVGSPILPNNTRPYYPLDGAKTQGFELDVNGQITAAWQLFAGFSHFRNRTPAGDAFNTYIPRSMLSLFSTYQLPSTGSKVTIGGGVNWQSQFHSTITTPQLQRVKVGQTRYAVYTLMLRHQTSKQLQFALHVNNLFNKTYYPQVGIGAKKHYGEPRNVQLSIRYRLI